MTNAWENWAACHGSDPEAWFPHSGELESDRTNEARDICKRCPVRRDCGEAAMDEGEQFGIRAGFYLADADERVELREFLGRPPVAEGSSLGEGVPAGPARDRIIDLLAMHVTLADIAERAGVTLTHVRATRKPSTGMIPHAVSEALLSVPVPEVPLACNVCGRTGVSRITTGLCPACYKRPGSGVPRNFVDADPARQHLRRLQAAGMTLPQITSAAGVIRSVITDLLYGKCRAAGERTQVRRIQATTSEAILAVHVRSAVSA